MKLKPYRHTELFPLTDLHRQMNRLFEDFSFDLPRANGQEWSPLADVIETNGDIIVRVELPGVDAKEIDISVSGDLLTIRGKKPVEEETEDRRWWRRETLDGEFSRAIPLPVEIDADKIQAIDHAGVLTITMPKAAAATPRRIKIRTA